MLLVAGGCSAGGRGAHPLPVITQLLLPGVTAATSPSSTTPVFLWIRLPPLNCWERRTTSFSGCRNSPSTTPTPCTLYFPLSEEGDGEDAFFHEVESSETRAGGCGLAAEESGNRRVTGLVSGRSMNICTNGFESLRTQVQLLRT
jgi:hypothetical protein